MDRRLGPEGSRVNGVSAGPIRTLAASGTKRFRRMLGYNEKQTPLCHNTTINEVSYASAFLLSNFARGITGEILDIEGGFSTTAMGDLEGE